ncbi:MAG: hypothetical protein ACTHU0_38185 [Kofleriaceae bacterium]
MSMPTRKSELEGLRTGPRLRALTPTVTAIPSTARFFEAQHKLMPGVRLPLRSMLVEAGDQRILISPVATREEADAVGDELTTLVAPSLLHHLFVEQAIHRYQPVALWGPPGFAEQRPQFAPVHVLGVHDWPHRDYLDFVLVEGAPRRNEVVFFHRASRTIYTADLFFHILARHGVLTPITFRAMGIYKRFAMPRAWRRWVTDRGAFQRSIRKILDWNFDRVAMAHGQIVECDGRSQVERAVRELGLLD